METPQRKIIDAIGKVDHDDDNAGQHLPMKVPNRHIGLVGLYDYDTIRKQDANTIHNLGESLGAVLDSSIY